MSISRAISRAQLGLDPRATQGKRNCAKGTWSSHDKSKGEGKNKSQVVLMIIMFF